MAAQDMAAQDSSVAAGGGGGGGTVGRLRALVDTVVGNLELRISNIHVRYEDTSSNPGHTFCIGLLLSEISAHTAGDDWRRTFVTADALQTLRKVRGARRGGGGGPGGGKAPGCSGAHIMWACTPPCTPACLSVGWLQVVQLTSLAVYFDCDMALLEPGKRWDLITLARWDELMLPAHHAPSGSSHPAALPAGGGGSSSSLGGSSGGGAAPTSLPIKQQAGRLAAAWVAGDPVQPGKQPQQQPAAHQFLLCPVDGTLRYVRRGRRARVLESDAAQEAHLHLQQIGVQLHQLQYRSSRKLLQEFDSYAASAPHRHLRPHCRPAAGTASRLWWRYAITVVTRQQQSYSASAWRQLRMVAAYHKQYVQAYLRWLQQGRQGSGDPTIDKLDGKLDEAVVMLFRRMAHARLKAVRTKAASAAAAAGGGKAQPQQQTWLGWLMGAPPKPVQQQLPAPPPRTSAGGEGSGPGGGEGQPQQQEEELDTSMGVQEWNKLEEVLAEQAVRLWVQGVVAACALRWPVASVRGPLPAYSRQFGGALPPKPLAGCAVPGRQHHALHRHHHPASASGGGGCGAAGRWWGAADAGIAGGPGQQGSLVPENHGRQPVCCQGACVCVGVGVARHDGMPAPNPLCCC
jgi:vacuolar protein sorting-associated protein 13A/C